MILRKFCLSVSLAMVAVVAAQAQVDEGDEPRSMQRSPTLHFAGDRYRIGVGIDTEFDIIGEFQASLAESPRSAFIGEGWLGGEGAGGLKLNYHWLFNATSEEGADGPVYTDGRIAKLFVAADRNQLDDRKLTFGGGYEYRDWFFSGYGMTALSDERRVNRAIDLDEVLVEGEINGRGFSRIDTIETITDFFEEPYEWGAGLRAGRYFDTRQVRLRGGLDYESGDFSSSQLTASVSLDKQFGRTPHSLSLRTGYARKRGDFVDDREDWRASLVYGYNFGRSFQPSTAYREEEVTVDADPDPEYEERVVSSEVTLSDRATFDFDKSELRPEARETLNDLVDAIREGGLVSTIEVVGHTCDIGTEEYNQGLSERRARSVVEYLASRGIEKDEINWEGKGELDPRFPNDSEENRSRNRRVEVRFATERSTTERVRVGPDEPVTEIRQVEVPVEAPWIRRALRNPVRHKRIVDYYRYQESSSTVTEGEIEFDNEQPVANDDAFSVETDSVDNVLDVLANDTDPDGDPLSIVDVSQPSNGQADVSNGTVVYTPASGFEGTDTFTYTIDDGFDGQDSATVSVAVQSPNQDPEAGDISVSTPLNQPVDVDVLAAASDPDGDSLVIESFSQPGNGSVSQVGDVLRYEPASEFQGEDSFTYTVSDGQGGQATGTVTVTVAGASTNRAPVARYDEATAPANGSVTVEVLANDFDPDGDELEVIHVEQWYGWPADAVINADNTITFSIGEICKGIHHFSYTITDPFGATATANVTIYREGSETESSSGSGDVECLMQ